MKPPSPSIRDGRHILANVISSQIKLHQQYGGVVPELASREHIVNTASRCCNAALARAGVTWEEIDAIAVTRGPGLAGALLVGREHRQGAGLRPAVSRWSAVNHLEGHIYSNWLIPEGQQARAAATRPAPAAPAPVRPRRRRAPPKNSPGRVASLVGYGRAAHRRPAAPATQPALPIPAPHSALPNPQSGDPPFPLICLVVSGGHTELLYMTGHGEYRCWGGR